MKIYYRLNIHPMFDVGETKSFTIADNEFFNKLKRTHPNSDNWNQEIYREHARNLIIASGIPNPVKVMLDVSYRDVGNYLMSDQKKECTLV